MNLYLIHCGFYDEEISDGIYEFHVNIPVVASSIDLAKSLIRQQEQFKKKKMHIDGVQEIQFVGGYQISLTPLAQGTEQEHLTQIASYPHRDL